MHNRTVWILSRTFMYTRLEVKNKRDGKGDPIKQGLERRFGVAATATDFSMSS